MKFAIKHTFIVALLFFLSIAKAQKTIINFTENDYKSALEKSKANKKPIFVMVYATWCPHCNKMMLHLAKQMRKLRMVML